MTDLDLISIGAKHSTPGQFSREFTEEQWISAARAIESAATAPLLDRIAHLEATASANYGRSLKDGQTHAEERIAELEAERERNLDSIRICNTIIEKKNAEIARISAASASPEQRDQSEQHLGMVECRHCGGTGDAPYMTTSPVPYQRTEKCATCDGAGMVAQTPNAQQAEPAMEPFLLRDLSQELGVAVPFLSQQIARNSLGNYSMNMALPVHVAAAMRKIHKQIEGFAQTNLEQPINRCDGCRRGLPIVNGLHDGGSWDKMVCQADRYIEAPQVDHEVSDLR